MNASSVVGALLFAAFGVCTEIVFTGVWAGADASFKGQVSLLMVPVYVTAYLLIGPLLRFAGARGVTSRWKLVPFGVLVVYALEWSFGAFYQELGFRPWRYDHGWASDFSGGHITLYYAPAWCLFVLIAVPVYRAIRRVAPLLAEGMTRRVG